MPYNGKRHGIDNMMWLNICNGRCGSRPEGQLSRKVLVKYVE